MFLHIPARLLSFYKICPRSLSLSSHSFCVVADQSSAMTVCRCPAPDEHRDGPARRLRRVDRLLRHHRVVRLLLRERRSEKNGMASLGRDDVGRLGLSVRGGSRAQRMELQAWTCPWPWVDMSHHLVKKHLFFI